jgi:hypothetical protein
MLTPSDPFENRCISIILKAKMFNYIRVIDTIHGLEYSLFSMYGADMKDQ